MSKSYIHQYVKSDPENLKGFQQERLLVDVASLMYQTMKECGINRTQLADILGVSKGRVTQILGGERNLTLRTLADIFTSLGRSLTVKAESLWDSMADWEAIPDLPKYVKLPRSASYNRDKLDGNDNSQYSLAA